MLVRGNGDAVRSFVVESGCERAPGHSTSLNSRVSHTTVVTPDSLCYRYCVVWPSVKGVWIGLDACAAITNSHGSTFGHHAARIDDGYEEFVLIIIIALNRISRCDNHLRCYIIPGDRIICSFISHLEIKLPSSQVPITDKTIMTRWFDIPRSIVWIPEVEGEGETTRGNALSIGWIDSYDWSVINFDLLMAYISWLNYSILGTLIAHCQLKLIIDGSSSVIIRIGASVSNSYCVWLIVIRSCVNR